mmetsp:Transcript_2217/g.7039  ORF Transcript_2217/g.7039 Transcript_2217/m.7039 type:complete len:219 (+) Transcript_2217:261-917(+)
MENSVPFGGIPNVCVTFTSFPSIAFSMSFVSMSFFGRTLSDTNPATSCLLVDRSSSSSRSSAVRPPVMAVLPSAVYDRLVRAPPWMYESSRRLILPRLYPTPWISLHKSKNRCSPTFTFGSEKTSTSILPNGFLSTDISRNPTRGTLPPGVAAEAASPAASSARAAGTGTVAAETKLDPNTPSVVSSSKTSRREFSNGCRCPRSDVPSERCARVGAPA